MGLFGKANGKSILTPEERRTESLQRLKKQKIAVNEHLPLLPACDEVRIKSTEEVKKRASGALLCAGLACSMAQEEGYQESLDYVLSKMREWNLEREDLLPKEQILIWNRYTEKGSEAVVTKQNIIDAAWGYETCYALLWSLELLVDREFGNATRRCDVQAAMFVSSLINDPSTKLRSADRILNMLDLYYCYHWACVEKRLKPETPVGKLNPEGVQERRRGLEWLISEGKDWNAVSLDT